MWIDREQQLAMAALLGSAAAVVIRVTGLGMVQTPAMHCPGYQAAVGAALLGLIGFAFVIALLALGLDAARYRRLSASDKLNARLGRRAIRLPAVVALLLLLLAIRPTVCM